MYQVLWWFQLADSRGILLGPLLSGSLVGQLSGPAVIPMTIEAAKYASYTSKYSLRRAGDYQVSTFLSLMSSCLFITAGRDICKLKASASQPSSVQLRKA